MATKRPPLYSMQSGRRRRRGPPRPPLGRMAVVAVAAVVLGAAAFAVWQVLPLTRTQEGIIPAAALTGVVPATSPGGQGQPAFDPKGASSQPIPGVHVSAGVIVDAGSGRVLWMRRAHTPRPIASLTKLMTALLADRGGVLHRFTITPAMTSALGYTIGLQAGERVSVRDMLAGALIGSANDAAAALAVHRAGSIRRFVALMNREAAKMHLADTHYSNPSGIIDQGNHSSAWDVAYLTRAVLQRPELRHLVGAKFYRPAHGSPFVNSNRLLWTYTGAIGVKTGQTALSGNCLAAAVRRHGHTVIAVELNAGGDEFDTAAHMLTWGLRRARR